MEVFAASGADDGPSIPSTFNGVVSEPHPPARILSPSRFVVSGSRVCRGHTIPGLPILVMRCRVRLSQDSDRKGGHLPLLRGSGWLKTALAARQHRPETCLRNTPIRPPTMNLSRPACMRLLAATCLLSLPEPAQAQITATGGVVPNTVVNPTWNVGVPLAVGNLTISVNGSFHLKF